MTYDRWVERSERPLLIIALLFLLVLCIPVINPTMTSSEALTVRILNYGIWAVFAVDYAVRLRLVDNRRRFVRTHIADLLVVLLPALRPLRLLRLLSLGQLLARRGTHAIVADISRFVAGAAALVVFLGAVVVLGAERDAQGANIRTFGDALWWACTTITTVGYGDRFPVTVEGRAVAVVLMVTGIALLGILTASIAAWFVQHVSHEARIEAAVQVEVRELAEIREQLALIQSRLSGDRADA